MTATLGAMDDLRRSEIIAACTRFIGNGRKSVGQLLAEVAASPYAEIKQDVYGTGGFVADFEREIATLLGKEEAVFMPSGTMAQQIALRIWCDRGSSRKVAFHPTCHLEIHEQGAYRELHHLEAELVGNPDHLFTLDDLKQIQGQVAALLIELPQREIGGQLPTWEELLSICKYGRSRGMKLHMDGARLWECAPYFSRSFAEISAAFDSVYVSFYKILGGLPGAMLAGPADFINEARVWQRRHGGNLYQLSPNAIAGKLGLERHMPRVHEYVAKAAEFADAIRDIDGVEIRPDRPPTNMMHIHLRGDKAVLEGRALAMAEETGTLLFTSLRPVGDRWQGFEMSVGESGLTISATEFGVMLEHILKD